MGRTSPKAPLPYHHLLPYDSRQDIDTCSINQSTAAALRDKVRDNRRHKRMLWSSTLLAVALLAAAHFLRLGWGETAVVSVVDDSSWAECLIKTYSIVESTRNSSNLTLYFSWSKETEVSKVWAELLEMSVVYWAVVLEKPSRARKSPH